MNNERNSGLDFLKIASTVIIFLHHYQQDFEVIFTNHVNFVKGDIYWRYLVELFFIISGYLMVRYIPAIINGEMKLDQWMGKRLRRLLPMMAVTVIAHEFLLLTYRHIVGIHPWDNYLPQPRRITLWKILISSLGLQSGGVFSNTLVNNPLWYLSVLIICYAVFYLACRMSAKLNCKCYYLFVFMVFLGLGIKEYTIILPFMNADSARGYTAFFTGVLLALYTKTYGISKIEYILSFAVLAVVSAAYVVKPDFILSELYYVLIFLVYPAIVILSESPVVKKLFSHSFWSKSSAVAFNVYVWHNPLFIGVYLFTSVTALSIDYSKPVNMYLMLLAVVLFSAFSHKYIEKPLDRLVGRATEAMKKRRENISVC